MRVFITRVFGFDPERWPGVSFGFEGHLHNLIEDSQAGDLIGFVATQGENVAPRERGALLGLAEFGRIEVETLSIIDRDSLGPQHWNNDGTFRWPYSLPLLRAWRIDQDPPPHLRDVLGRQLSYSATVSAQRLPEADANAILGWPWREVTVQDSEAMRAHQRTARRLGPTRGPGPTSGTFTGERQEDIAQTYVMRFGQRNVWKIGYAKDPRARLNEVNAHVPEEELGEGWRIAYTGHRVDAEEAHRMEAELLERLSAYRTERERVCCRPDVMEQAWIELHAPRYAQAS